MKTEVNPQDTTRAEAFEMWITSPMPMVTLTKTFNVGKIVKAGKKLGIKFVFRTFLVITISSIFIDIGVFFLIYKKVRGRFVGRPSPNGFALHLSFIFIYV